MGSSQRMFDTGRAHYLSRDHDPATFQKVEKEKSGVGTDVNAGVRHNT
jgi:hypothetical protein